jgi:hypothetical protein
VAHGAPLGAHARMRRRLRAPWWNPAMAKPGRAPLTKGRARHGFRAVGVCAGRTGARREKRLVAPVPLVDHEVGSWSRPPLWRANQAAEGVGRIGILPLNTLNKMQEITCLNLQALASHGAGTPLR